MNTETPTVITAEPVTDMPVAPSSPTSNLNDLLNSGSYRVKEEHSLVHRRTVEPANSSAANTTALAVPQDLAVFAPPSANAQLAQRTRNGKIARLPKLYRDMVNKLLHNNIPHPKIVEALADHNVFVTKRNISNWHTRGGYKEWCAEQENQLQLAHIQDHLIDYLRKHDAEQLPEVGLQVAATQLTSLLMNPQTAGPLLNDPVKYSKIVEMLDKCSSRLSELQGQRYESLRRSHIKDTTENLRYKEAKRIETTRQITSAEHLGQSIYEEDIPHRNELPPRETLPRYDVLTREQLIDKAEAIAARRRAQETAGNPGKPLGNPGSP